MLQLCSQAVGCMGLCWSCLSSCGSSGSSGFVWDRQGKDSSQESSMWQTAIMTFQVTNTFKPWRWHAFHVSWMSDNLFVTEISLDNRFIIYEFYTKLDLVKISHFCFALPDAPGQNKIQFSKWKRWTPTEVTNSLSGGVHQRAHQAMRSCACHCITNQSEIFIFSV